jgi:hypothetical protein
MVDFSSLSAGQGAEEQFPRFHQDVRISDRGNCCLHGSHWVFSYSPSTKTYLSRANETHVVCPCLSYISRGPVRHRSALLSYILECPASLSLRLVCQYILLSYILECPISLSLSQQPRETTRSIPKFTVEGIKPGGLKIMRLYALRRRFHYNMWSPSKRAGSESDYYVETLPNEASDLSLTSN